MLKLPKLFNPDLATPGIKPTGLVKVDRGNQYGRHISYAFLPQSSIRDAARNLALNTHGGAKLKNRNAAFFGHSGDFVEYPEAADIRDEITIIAKIRRNDYNSHGGIFSDKDNSNWGAGEGISFNVRPDSSNLFFIVGNAECWPEYGYRTIDSTSEFFTVAATWKKGQFQRVYVNGYEPTTYQTLSVASSYQKSSKPLRVGAYYDASNLRTFDGEIAYVFALNKALSTAEIRSLSKNPYQVFEAPYPQYLFSVAGGVSSVANSIAINWDMLSSVEKGAQILWNLLHKTSSSSSIKWDLLQSVLSDSELRWSLIESVNNSVRVDWHLLAALTAVSNSTEAQWNLLNKISNDLNTEWDLLASIGSSTRLDWDLLSALASVSNGVQFNWDMAGQVKAQLDAQWSLLESVGVSADLRWDLANSVASQIQSKWDMLQGANSNVSLEWDSIAATSNGLKLSWSIQSDSARIPIHVMLVLNEDRIMKILN